MATDTIQVGDIWHAEYMHFTGFLVLMVDAPDFTGDQEMVIYWLDTKDLERRRCKDFERQLSGWTLFARPE